ncbi:MAG: matrixin family metalloprotease [Alphaproteobacteria bacterium]|nr:matrixin family metalloprotease [Alphaproteobacteria bacterium]
MRPEPRLAAAALLLSLPALAWGYAYNGAGWSWQSAPLEDPIELSTESFPEDVGSEDEIEAAFTTVFEAWRAVGTALNLEYGGRITDPAMDTDGRFTVHYSEDIQSSSDGALAFAAIWAYEDGQAFDCDIVFQSENGYGALSWSADPEGPPSGRYDVEAVALHEVGHCLGLGHSEDNSAVMHAYYAGRRALTDDDAEGLESIYGAPCVDGDGDGYSDCASDCDDANAAIHPGAAEVCDGVDNNCDGLVDADTERSVVVGADDTSYDSQWVSVANLVELLEPRTLRRVTARLSVPEGTRLVWSVYGADALSEPFTLLRSARSLAGAEDLHSSPDLDLPLEAGRVYRVGLGALSDTVTFWYEAGPRLRADGPLQPLGSSYSRAIGDESSRLDTSTLFAQEWLIYDLADADGDGFTADCGDCDPEDPAAYDGAEELCDGVDQDCDELVDEGFDADADADGVLDCVDPCPLDKPDDSDGDGVCDSEDPCPLDSPDDRDGDGACDSEDLCPDDVWDRCAPEPVDSGVSKDGGACGCGGGAGAAGAWGLLLVLGALTRRRA